MKNKVAILGNWNGQYEPHVAMNKRLGEFSENIDFDWIPTEMLAESAMPVLNGYQGIVAGSGPYKSKQGIINGIRYARENNIPFLGTCSGFGYAVLEFGQSLFNLEAVYHPYEKADLPGNEIFLQPLNFCKYEMHAISFRPVDGTLTSKIYKTAGMVDEESHCTYGINSRMTAPFEREGLIVSGSDDEGEAKIMEYTRNDFFVITLFLPQLKRGLTGPHPLFATLIDHVKRPFSQVV
jgi:CTP synthase (UTP-ammonia lyase)